MIHEYLWDDIAGQQIQIENWKDCFSFADSLNSALVTKEITYRNYYAIMQKFFPKIRIPGIMHDVLDYPIPVKRFYVDYSVAYADPRMIGDRYYTYTIKWIKK